MTTPAQTSAYFSRLRTSAEFAAAIDDATAKLIGAQKRKADLIIAEDAALFGEGDFDQVQTDRRAADQEIDELEKLIEGAQRRRQEAARNERVSEVEHVGKDAKEKADALSAELRDVKDLVEQLRAKLFSVDAMSISIGAANNTLESAGRRDLMVNLTSLRRTAMAGPRAAIPNRLSRKALAADKLLQQFLSLGGVLDRRTTAGLDIGEAVEVRGVAHHAFQQGH